MQRTQWTELAASFVAAGLLVYLVLRYSYADLGSLSYLVPVPVAGLALIELFVARLVKSAVRHDRDARPMAAVTVARWVALGKASALVGAMLAGAACGLVGWLAPDLGRVAAADHDARVSALVFGAGLLLGIAGLVLERAGIDPAKRPRR